MKPRDAIVGEVTIEFGHAGRSDLVNRKTEGVSIQVATRSATHQKWLQKR